MSDSAVTAPTRFIDVGGRTLAYRARPFFTLAPTTTLSFRSRTGTR